MKRTLAIIIVLILALLMVFTTPEKNTHKQVMMEVVKDYVDEEAEKRLGDNIFADLGKIMANNSAKDILENKLRLHDYFFFNTTTMHLDGNDYLMSVGILNHVFTFDKETLQKRLDEAVNLKEEKKEEKITF